MSDHHEKALDLLGSEWQARYVAMVEMKNAEIGLLHEKVDTLAMTVDELRRQIRNLSTEKRCSTATHHSHPMTTRP